MSKKEDYGHAVSKIRTQIECVENLAGTEEADLLGYLNTIRTYVTELEKERDALRQRIEGAKKVYLWKRLDMHGNYFIKGAVKDLLGLTEEAKAVGDCFEHVHAVPVEEKEGD